MRACGSPGRRSGVATACGTSIARFRAGAAQLGLKLLPSATPIQPLSSASPGAALRPSARLWRPAGILVPAIRPPTVPAGTARLRVTFSALHELADVDRLLEALAGECPVTPRRYFITGTDTGVGKTLVTAALLLNARSLRPARRGREARVGRLHAGDGQLVNDDALLLQRYASVPARLRPGEPCGPRAGAWRPHIAAARAGLVLGADALAAAVHSGR